MVSFFRKKPERPRYNIEELAAAFPDAQRDQERAREQKAKEGAAAAESAQADKTRGSAAPAGPGQPPATTGASPPVPAEIIAAALETRPLADAPVTAGELPTGEPIQAPPASAPTTLDNAPPAPASNPVVDPAAALATAFPAPRREFVDPAEGLVLAPRPAASPGKSGWRERLGDSVLARSVSTLFSRNPQLDDDLLDEIETALITADVGVGATTDLVEGLRKRMKAREFTDARALLGALRADLVALLKPVALPLEIDSAARPFVILTVGVNGVGKTTTIGKLARRYKDEGRPMMLAAGDTFRAAAVAQLQAWGDRNGVPVVAQGQNADAASVAFDALQAAKARGTQVLIADTAGRLHTQHGLMAELGKIKRVIQKLDAAAPHEVLMVIDGTTGQNALSQLRQFHASVGVTGLVVTKLDGTAKGGVVFALAREFGIPIRYAGIGERPEDLRVFDAEAFVDALLPESLAT